MKQHGVTAHKKYLLRQKIISSQDSVKIPKLTKQTVKDTSRA